MNGFRDQPGRFRWRWPFYAAAVTFIFVPLVEFVGGYDNGFFGAVALEISAVLLCCCAALGALIGRRYVLALAFISVIPSTLLSSTLGLLLSTATRSDVRWLFEASRYKAELLQQSSTEDGTLRHVEWDGWGFAGNDTTEYLVFDPSDSLPRHSKVPTRFKGIPCEVPEVKRVEAHWYIVLFYTDTAWNFCGESS